MLCTGLYMVLGPCAMYWSIQGPENGITSVYGQWNSILVMCTCGSSGIYTAPCPFYVVPTESNNVPSHTWL